MSKLLRLVGILLVAVLLTPAAFGGGQAEAVAETVTLEYVLWDSAQLDAYEEAAEVFMERHPEIRIEINQLGWGDYWEDLARRLALGDAPDVWTNQLGFFRDFAVRGQMIPLDDRIAESEIIDLDAFMPGLVDLFVFEGVTYGLPKDWDTIAIIYNRELLADAGIDESELQDLTWNPDDGGTFQEMIQRLTFDQNGNNGLSPGFDRNNVARYGYAEGFDGIGAWGQTQWSWLATTLGWYHHDGTATNFNYDQPEFISMVEWMKRMTDHGYYVPFEDSIDVDAMFVAGEVPMITNGSWRIRYYVDNMGDNVGFAPVPRGPQGRNSMFNGLSDAIWSGTDHPEEAWKWVEFLATPEAQEIVGQHGPVFPAIESATEIRLKNFAEMGHDLSAFTDVAFEPDKNHYYFIAENAVTIDNIMQDAFERVWLAGDDPGERFRLANEEINALFD